VGEGNSAAGCLGCLGIIAMWAVFGLVTGAGIIGWAFSAQTHVETSFHWSAPWNDPAQVNADTVAAFRTDANALADRVDALCHPTFVRRLVFGKVKSVTVNSTYSDGVKRTANVPCSGVNQLRTLVP
jgi:hypothetical protein